MTSADSIQPLINKQAQGDEDILQMNKNQIELKWVNLKVQALSDNQQKIILNNVSGYALRGQLTAIMGPSGSGKTTLISFLSKRIDPDRNLSVSGEVDISKKCSFHYVNGCPYGHSNKTLDFAAKMRIRGTDQQKQKIVDHIIRQLNLQHCVNTLVGSEIIKGISGGERKRVCIGVELIANPSLMILDEPTSGLDSFTAFRLVNILKRIATDEQKTILFTIHQPSSEIFEMFDRLILIKKGDIVFQDQSNRIIDYLQQFGVTVPEYINPSDFFMQYLQDFTNTKYTALLKENNPLTLANYKFNELQSASEQQIGDQHIHVRILVAADSIFQKFYQKTNVFEGEIISIFVVLLVDCLYNGIGKFNFNNEKNTSYFGTYMGNVGGYLFMVGTSCFMTVQGTLTLTFPSERNLFLKEENAGAYRIVSYFFGKMTIELPYIFIFPILIALGTFWCINLQGSFIEYALVCSLTALCANGMGLLTGSLFSSSRTAAAMSPMLLLPFMLFGGFYSNLGIIPSWIAWFKYISPFNYFFQAFINNQFQDWNSQFDEFNEQHPVVNPPDMPLIKYNPIKELGISVNYLECILLLGMIVILLHVLAFLTLRAKTKSITN